jgi:hypothetical protein
MPRLRIGGVFEQSVGRQLVNQPLVGGQSGAELHGLFEPKSATTSERVPLAFGLLAAVAQLAERLGGPAVIHPSLRTQHLGVIAVVFGPEVARDETADFAAVVFAVI